MEELAEDFETTTSPTDTSSADIVERINSLNELSWGIKKRDTKSAFELALQARSLAATHAHESGLAYGLRNSSCCQQLMGNYRAGLVEAREALTLFEKLDDRRGVASAMNCVGKIYDSLGEYSKAIEFCTGSLEVFAELNDELGTLNPTSISETCTFSQVTALERWISISGACRQGQGSVTWNTGIELYPT